MKKIFIIVPICITLPLIVWAYFVSNYWQNLFFCIASVSLTIFTTFIVVDKYYKLKENSENTQILCNLAQMFNTLTLNTYLLLREVYVIDIDLNEKEIFINNKLMIEEINKIIDQIKKIQLNGDIKYKNSQQAGIQITLLKDNLNEIKNLFLYLPKTLDIYKNCFPILLNVIYLYNSFETVIRNKDKLLSIDLSMFFLEHLKKFNERFICEIKNLKFNEINDILFNEIKNN